MPLAVSREMREEGLKWVCEREREDNSKPPGPIIVIDQSEIIYFIKILHTNLIYSKYTLISVTIILRPFMLIILFEYTCNMVFHIHSKYTFIS